MNELIALRLDMTVRQHCGDAASGIKISLNIHASALIEVIRLLQHVNEKASRFDLPIV